MKKVLIVLGMHRSGTSLLAKWLSHCGLFLGHRQLESNYSNSTGHYEDLDFLELHEELFEKNQIAFGGFEKIGKIPLDVYDQKKIKHLINFKNDLNHQWGWKEPRTCLFVDFYQKLLPDANYFIIFRNYPEVVDSLMRRKFKENYIYFAEKPFPTRVLFSRRTEKKTLKIFPNIYLKSWCDYNRKLIDFIESSPKNAPNLLIFDTRTMIESAPQIFKTLDEDWKFSLNYEPIDKVMVKGKLQQNKIDFRFSNSLEDEAKAIYERLKELSNLN